MNVPNSPWTLYTSRQRWIFLAILFLVSMSNYMDRMVISILLEPIRLEFHVSDTMLGLLSGFSFSIFYALFGMPVARWADRGNRRTIITLALAVWSIMTMLCGFAQTFWQLVLARVGVGAGESGAIPPAQSLIADYFPPQRRASAIAIFTAAGTAGYLIGTGWGGYIAATHGWRSALLLLGAPGLILALLVRLTLAEPRLQMRFTATGAAAESVREALAALLRKRSFIYVLAGSLLYFFVAYGALVFLPSFLVRVLHVPLARVSVTMGIVAAIASVIGTLGGGWVADRLSRRDVRWLAWLPAIACTLTAPFFVLALSMDDFVAFIAVFVIANLLLTGGLPSTFAALHMICGSRRRAVAVAIVLFSGTLFGGGLGPLATGALSDVLSASHGLDGLRYSLMSAVTVLMAAGGFYYAFGRAMPKDEEI